MMASASGHRGTRSRIALIVAAALVAGVIVAVALISSSGERPRPRPSPSPRAATGSGLPPGQGALVARLLHGTTMRVSAGGRPLAKLNTRTQFGSAQALWVVRVASGWLGVVSPQAGNGRLGWIPQSAVRLTRVPWELRVSLSARRLTVIDGGSTVARYSVAIGRSDAPTPTGRFDVTDRIVTHDPTGPYGCCILALSAHAPHAIQGWTGGDRIAIHSTPETGSIGLPVSHGCLRLTLAEGRWLLAHVPLGTPALIDS